MKRFYLLMLLALGISGMQAQKIDQRLTRLAKQTNLHRVQGKQTGKQAVTERIAVGYDEDGSIRSLSVQAYLKEGAQCPTEQLEQMGITVRYVVDNIAVLSVPLDKVGELENIDEIQFAKADELVKFNNNKAREVTKAYSLSVAENAALVGLKQAYIGKGVVLGVVDAGIDFNHRAFMDSQDNNRIKRVMVITKDGNSAKFTTPEAIKQLDTDFIFMSHGTHTLAIAAGAEHGNSLQGVAPETELVAVGLNETVSESNISQGIRFISDYADEVKKPCVISLSLGKEIDLHDGSSLVAKTIKEITANGTKEGKAVLVSASNSANCWGSIIKTLGAADGDGYQLKAIMGNTVNTNEKDPDLDEYPEPVYNSFDIFAYATDGKDFTAEIKIVNIKTGVVTSNLTGKITNGEYPSEPRTVELTKISNYPTVSGATAVVYKASYEGKFGLKDPNERLAIFIKGNQGQTIKLINGDNGAKELNFFVPAALANQGYTEGTNDFSINTYACDDAVISVGSTVSRTEWDYYQAPAGHKTSLEKSVVTGQVPKVGDVSDFSSYCIADDNGKARPTVLAPGQSILSAYNRYDITSFADGVPTTFFNQSIYSKLVPELDQVYWGGKTYWYGAMSGTSMSCPHAAGIVALWMQADPKLTVNRIKDILKDTSVKVTVDKCPSKDIQQAGYGLIDAVAGLKKVLETTGIEEIEMSKTDVDHSVVYNIMGQRVNKNTRGLIISNGKKYIVK